jgi:hypothetical protein
MEAEEAQHGNRQRGHDDEERLPERRNREE